MPAIGIISLLRKGDGEQANTDPAKIIQGTGQARIWNAHSDATDHFHAGHWQGSPGAIRVNYTETELCMILSGRVRLKDWQGGTAEFGPGEAFVVASGFIGTWENLGEVTKVYAICEPRK